MLSLPGSASAGTTNSNRRRASPADSSDMRIDATAGGAPVSSLGGVLAPEPLLRSPLALALLPWPTLALALLLRPPLALAPLPWPPPATPLRLLSLSVWPPLRWSWLAQPRPAPLPLPPSPPCRPPPRSPPPLLASPGCGTPREPAALPVPASPSTARLPAFPANALRRAPSPAAPAAAPAATAATATKPRRAGAESAGTVGHAAYWVTLRACSHAERTPSPRLEAHPPTALVWALRAAR
eukprot:363930-Chlamydomonas_euryale.AAC.10